MSSKVTYNESYSKKEYEKELDKSLKLGCIEHALLFYHFDRYCKLQGKEFISDEKYCDLCDFLADNLDLLPRGLQQYVVLQDVMLYDCKLEIELDADKFTKGKHLVIGIGNLMAKLEARIPIDFSLEVVEELDSTN